jgi:hypothetical protein
VTLVVPVGWVFNPPQIDTNQHGLAKSPARSIAARGQSLLALPKSNQEASPCTPLHPAVLATSGTRQRHTKASLTLRTVCADDASTTARCSAPRRGLKGRFVGQQLFDEILAEYGLISTNANLSTIDGISDLAHIEWAFQGKAACSPDARHPGSYGVHSNGNKFDFARLRNPDASIPATRCKRNQLL